MRCSVWIDRHLERVTSSTTGNQTVERQEWMQGIRSSLWEGAVVGKESSRMVRRDPQHWIFGY